MVETQQDLSEGIWTAIMAPMENYETQVCDSPTSVETRPQVE